MKPIMRVLPGASRSNKQKRLALLINQYDQPSRIPFGYTRLRADIHGNRCILGIEAALQRGRLDLTNGIQRRLIELGHKIAAFEAAGINDKVREIYYQYQMKNKNVPPGMLVAIRAAYPEGPCRTAALMACQTYIDIQAFLYHSEKNSGYRYEELKRIWPDTENVRQELFSALKILTEASTNESLTVCFVRSRGTFISGIGYDEFFNSMDLVKGKKVIISISNFENKLMGELKKRKAKNFFALLFVLPEVNDNPYYEAPLITRLCKHIASEKRLIDFISTIKNQVDLKAYVPFEI